MENIVMGFSEFINEELNLTKYDNGVCRFSDRWFYYDIDDDIIYGCDEKPVGNGLFAFNPSSCTIIIVGEEKNYDINNPICLIKYNMDNESVIFYTDNAIKYLNKLGFSGSDVTSMSSRNKIQDIFEDREDDRYILIYGNQLLASTFDVIEEN